MYRTCPDQFQLGTGKCKCSIQIPASLRNRQISITCTIKLTLVMKYVLSVDRKTIVLWSSSMAPSSVSATKMYVLAVTFTLADLLLHGTYPHDWVCSCRSAESSSTAMTRRSPETPVRRSLGPTQVKGVKRMHWSM